MSVSFCSWVSEASAETLISGMRVGCFFVLDNQVGLQIPKTFLFDEGFMGRCTCFNEIPLLVVSAYRLPSNLSKYSNLFDRFSLNAICDNGGQNTFLLSKNCTNLKSAFRPIFVQNSQIRVPQNF